MHNVTAHLDPVTKARMIDGDWNAFAVDKPFFYNFSLAKHVIESYEPNPHLPIQISMDFNVQPMTSIISQKLNVMDSVTFDEIKIDSGSVEEMCHQVKARYARWLGNLTITGDATGRNREKVRMGNITAYKLIKQELNLKDREINVPNTNMAIKDSRTLCASVQHHSGWRITKNCKLTISDCVNSQVDEEGELIKTQNKGAHFLDCQRYSLHDFYFDFISNPRKYQK
jgi:hypothetical protein